MKLRPRIPPWDEPRVRLFPSCCTWASFLAWGCDEQAAPHTLVEAFCGHRHLSLWGKCPEGELLGHRADLTSLEAVGASSVAVPFTPPSDGRTFLLHVLLFDFFTSVILVGVQWRLTVAFIFIPLLNNDIGFFFFVLIGLLHILFCTLSAQVFAKFLLGCLSFSYY